MPGATANSSLSYTVVAVDAAANRSACEHRRGRRLRHELAADADEHRRDDPDRDGTRVTWTSGGADNLSGLAYYAVFRGSTQIGTTSSLSFTDSLLATTGRAVLHGQGRRPRGQHERRDQRAHDRVRSDAPGTAGQADDREPDARARADLVRGDRHGRLEHRALRRLPARSPAARATLAGSVTGTTFTDTTREPGRHLHLRRRRRRRRGQPERALGRHDRHGRRHAARRARRA